MAKTRRYLSVIIGKIMSRIFMLHLHQISYFFIMRTMQYVNSYQFELLMEM